MNGGKVGVGDGRGDEMEAEHIHNICMHCWLFLRASATRMGDFTTAWNGNGYGLVRSANGERVPCRCCYPSHMRARVHMTGLHSASVTKCNG